MTGFISSRVAVGHSIIVIVYHILLRNEPYRDLGADYFDQRRQEAITRHHVRRLRRLGYAVTLEPLTDAA